MIATVYKIDSDILNTFMKQLKSQLYKDMEMVVKQSTRLRHDNTLFISLIVYIPIKTTFYYSISKFLATLHTIFQFIILFNNLILIGKFIFNKLHTLYVK